MHRDWRLVTLETNPADILNYRCSEPNAPRRMKILLLYYENVYIRLTGSDNRGDCEREHWKQSLDTLGADMC